jgi:PadR family transcriptional regulator
MQKTDLLPGTLEMLILKTWSAMRSRCTVMASPCISNNLPRGARRRGGLHVEEGSLYPALQRLAIKGVKAAWGQTENNRRARFYTMTTAGRKQLKQEVADFERLLEAILLVMQPT